MGDGEKGSWKGPRVKPVHGLIRLGLLHVAKVDVWPLRTSPPQGRFVQHWVKGQVCWQSWHASGQSSVVGRAEGVTGGVGGLGAGDSSHLGTAWALNLEATQIWKGGISCSRMASHRVQDRRQTDRRVQIQLGNG